MKLKTSVVRTSISGPVATCAGSAWGDKPPRDPTRLPKPYEPSAVAPIHKGRGKAKLLDVARNVVIEGKLNV
ncbi:hypothetical protein TIFTF001_040657 [Ficus carica]|uniref:Uncharacterized protein n=1 Tax=Ficus carica TaxID=3494 RepID=A0AA87YWC2_FICCA|nr:hypothetical protein TIFTF001_040657 [Ficus carica]